MHNPKTHNIRKPKLSLDQVCECKGSGIENMCGKIAKGCRLTTKAPKPFPTPVEPVGWWLVVGGLVVGGWWLVVGVGG